MKQKTKVSDRPEKAWRILKSFVVILSDFFQATFFGLIECEINNTNNIYNLIMKYREVFSIEVFFRFFGRKLISGWV